MKSITIYIKPLLLTVLLFSVVCSLKGQTKEGLQPGDALFQTILRNDSLVFDAFNRRDTAAFNPWFAKDLEFYHDEGGLTGYQRTTTFLLELVENKNDVRRELVKEGMRIYPIPGYGAMQIGAHLFCHNENGKKTCARYEFVHIWKEEKGNWKITRVISYGH